ncbi:DUF2029 domain-containing protein [bacterium]|nr:DUF2029 domain-containing protein [bacterium]
MLRGLVWLGVLAQFLAPAACLLWPDPLIYWLVSLVAWAFYALTIWIWQHRPELNWSVNRLLGMSCLLGLAWSFLPPLWENDFFRYSWDGHVLLNGINPYLFEPENPALNWLRRPVDEQVAYAWVPTCYPPLAILYFGWNEAVSQALQISPLACLRASGLLLSLAVSLLISRLAGQSWKVWVWAGNPMMLKEICNGAHYDGLCVFVVTLALLFRQQGRSFRAGLCLGLAVCLKTYPLLLAPFWVARLDSGRSRFWSGFLAGCLLPHLPFLGAGGLIWKGFLVFARRWEFNAQLLWLFKLVSGASGLEARRLSGVVLAIVLLARWGYSRIRLVDSSAFLDDSIFVLGALYLFSPVLDPWYLCWILPFLALRGNFAWLAMTGLASASYLFYLDRQATPGLIALQLLPFSVLQLGSLWQGGSRSCA